MARLFFVSCCLVFACLSHGMFIHNLKQREFDLHKALEYAFDRESLRKVLEEATIDDVRNLFQSIQQDLNDIEALNDKIINHDKTTDLELNKEEWELITHLMIMDSYLPTVGDFGTSLFLDTCKEEYLKTNFSQFATFDEARDAAFKQIETCGANGLQTMDTVLELDADIIDLDCIDPIVQKIDRVARGLAEMFTLSRFFRVLMRLDGSKYDDPSNFNQVLRVDTFEMMANNGWKEKPEPRPKPGPKPDGNDRPGPKPDGSVQPGPKPNGNGRPGSTTEEDEDSGPPDSRMFGTRMDRIKKIKTRMLLESVLKKLEDSMRK